VREQQELTPKQAAQPVEMGKGPEDPGHVRPRDTAVLRVWHRCATASPMMSLTKMMRASERGGHGESKGTSNRIAIDHASRTSQLTNLAAHLTGGDETRKLAIAEEPRWLTTVRTVGHLRDLATDANN